MDIFKLVDTPFGKGRILSLSECPKTDEKINDISKVPYISTSGSMMYAMLCTIPSISFVVGMTSIPKQLRFNGKYLKGSSITFMGS